MLIRSLHFLIFFFFNDTATTEIYTLSLHDALPICVDALPPSPMNPWVKLPVLRTNVWSPRPNDWMSTVTTAHAVSTTLRYGPAGVGMAGRTSSIRSVSPETFEPRAASSQKRCPNSCLVSVVLTSFSMRSVALPLNGDELLAVGVVERSEERRVGKECR